MLLCSSISSSELLALTIVKAASATTLGEPLVILQVIVYVVSSAIEETDTVTVLPVDSIKVTASDGALVYH